MTRVVVTGAAGFVATHTVGALLDAGCEVVGIDAFTPFYAETEKRSNVDVHADRPGFLLVEGDLAELNLPPVLAGADAVVHLAAQAGVTGSWGTAFATYVRHNVLATQRLLEACLEAGVPRLVAASSSSVYGDAVAYPCTESATPLPVSPYGVTKLAMEQLCLTYARANTGRLDLALLRLFTVYGPHQRPDMALRRFLEAAMTGRPVIVYGDGEQTRDFTYVSDAARALLRAVEVPVPDPVLNIGGGCRVSINDTLRLVESVTGRPVTVVRRPTRIGETRHTGADCSLAEALLGYRPEVDLATGLAAEAAWLAGVTVPAARVPGMTEAQV
ncbi:MAG: NAD-dependent epimerase/dehydratase family protein [Actinomycetes bacterium]